MTLNGKVVGGLIDVVRDVTIIHVEVEGRQRIHMSAAASLHLGLPALPGETAEDARPLMVIERKTLAEWMKDPSFRAQLNAMTDATLAPSPSPGENKEGT